MPDGGGRSTGGMEGERRGGRRTTADCGMARTPGLPRRGGQRAARFLGSEAGEAEADGPSLDLALELRDVRVAHEARLEVLEILARLRMDLLEEFHDAAGVARLRD